MLLRRTVSILALVSAVLVAAPATARQQRTTSVGVGQHEFRVAIYRASVPSGVVRFNVENFGEDRHDLVVIDRNGREKARSAELRAGQRTVVSVRLAPGTYKLRCDVADHARRGMRGTISVRRPRR